MKAVAVSAFVLALATPALAGSTGLQVLNTIPVGGDGRWDYPAIDTVTNTLYLTHTTSIASVDLTTGKVNPHLADAEGAHIALPLGDGKTLLVTQGKANKVSFLDAQTGANLGDVATAGKPDGAILEPVTDKVFVLDNAGAQIDVVDPKTRKGVAKIKTTGAPEGMAVDGKGKMFTHYEDKNQLAVIDAKTLKVTKIYNMKDCDEPSGLAIVPDKHLALSACQNGVARITNIDTGAEVATVPVGVHPDFALYDSNARLGYIPSIDGKLTVISFDGKPHVVDVITTKSGAKTAALDPKTGRVYLPAGDLLPNQPEDTWVPVPGSFVVVVVGK